MRPSRIPLAGLVVLAALMAGCAQGPGHTRAAGTLAGTGAGALIGAAASPCDRGGGAAVGAVLGMMAGTIAGEGIAQDQERAECPPPCPPCSRCQDCGPRPVPRRGYVRYGPPPPGYYYVGPCYAPCPPPCPPPPCR